MSGMHWSQAITLPVPAKTSSDPASEARVLMSLAGQVGIGDPLPQVERLLEREHRLGQLQVNRRREAGAARAAALAELMASDELDGAALDRCVDAYRETGLWVAEVDLDGQPEAVPLAMRVLTDARAQLRHHAAQTLYGLGAGLYERFAQVAAAQVRAVEALADLPADAWSSVDPAGVLLRVDRGADWMTLIEADHRFQTAFNAGWMLRRDSLGAEGILPGALPRLAFLFKGWEDASAGLYDLRRLAQPLRLLRATRLGWRPGLWSASDYREPPARRGLLRR
jgi:hypothetical protein